VIVAATFIAFNRSFERADQRTRLAEATTDRPATWGAELVEKAWTKRTRSFSDTTFMVNPGSE